MKTNRYTCVHNWITLPYTWNYYNMVNQLYSSIKLKVKDKNKQSRLKPKKRKGFFLFSVIAQYLLPLLDSPSSARGSLQANHLVFLNTHSQWDTASSAETKRLMQDRQITLLLFFPIYSWQVHQSRSFACVSYWFFEGLELFNELFIKR